MSIVDNNPVPRIASCAMPRSSAQCRLPCMTGKLTMPTHVVPLDWKSDDFRTKLDLFRCLQVQDGDDLFHAADQTRCVPRCLEIIEAVLTFSRSRRPLNKHQTRRF